MDYLFLTLADTVLIAQPSAVGWHVQCTDIHSGKTHNSELSGVQLAAILAITLDNESGIMDTVPLYKIAESAIKEWPIECRPIP